MPIETWVLSEYEVEEIIRSHMTEVEGVPEDIIKDVTFMIEEGEWGFSFKGALVEFGSDD